MTNNYVLLCMVNICLIVQTTFIFYRSDKYMSSLNSWPNFSLIIIIYKDLLTLWVVYDTLCNIVLLYLIIE